MMISSVIGLESPLRLGQACKRVASAKSVSSAPIVEIAEYRLVNVALAHPTLVVYDPEKDLSGWNFANAAGCIVFPKPAA